MYPLIYKSTTILHVWQDGRRVISVFLLGHDRLDECGEKGEKDNANILKEKERKRCKIS